MTARLNRGRFRLAAGAAVFALAWLAGLRRPDLAQGQRRLSLIDLAELPRVLDPQLSPDGRFVAYTLTRGNWKADRQVPHVWRQSTAGGPPVQLTSGETGETTARWSPDGATILFVGWTSEGAQVQVISTDGGMPRVVTHHATSVSSPAWSADGSAVYFLAFDAKTNEQRDRERARGDVYAFDEDYTQRHLWKADARTGAEEPVTSGDFSVLGFRLSRDGKRLVTHRAPSPLMDDSVKSEMWVSDASGANARALTSNALEESEGELSPDNLRVLFLADANAREDAYYNTNIFIVSAATPPGPGVHGIGGWLAARAALRRA